MNSCLFINGVEIYFEFYIAFKIKINAALLCLGNASKDLSVDLISKDFFQNIFHMKKTELYGYIYYCSVDYDNIDADDILDKIIFRLLNKYLSHD